MDSTTLASPIWFLSFLIACQYVCTSRKRANLLKKFIAGNDCLNMLVSLAKAKPRLRVRSSVKISVSIASRTMLSFKAIKSMIYASVSLLS